MATSAELKNTIEAAIPGAQAEVQSPDDVHFTARVVSDRFSGMSRIQQHQLVYELFAGRLGGEIHALSLKTETP
ncbi:MAG: BolA family protein [Solirubrobacteraceae bacterium]|nr:BolA family protein [Solirubrobacteraceae bacterium]